MLAVTWGGGPGGLEGGDAMSDCQGKQKPVRLEPKFSDLFLSVGYGLCFGERMWKKTERRTLHFFCELPMHNST